MQRETHKDRHILEHIPERRTLFYKPEQGFRLDKSVITFKGESVSDGLLSPVTAIQEEEMWGTGPSRRILVFCKIFGIICLCEVNDARKLLSFFSYKTVAIPFTLQNYEHWDVRNKSFTICFVKVCNP
jgi:hypothetical protein